MIIEGYKDIQVLHTSLNYMVELYQRSSSFPVEKSGDIITGMRSDVLELCNVIAIGYTGFNHNFFLSCLNKANQTTQSLQQHIDTAYQRKLISEQEKDSLATKLVRIQDMLDSYNHQNATITAANNPSKAAALTSEAIHHQKTA